MPPQLQHRSPRLVARAGIVALLALLLCTVPASAARHLGDRVLKKGMRGADVRALQRSLTRAGFPTPVTGLFGDITRRNVKRFERRHHLAADGIAGPGVVGTLSRATHHRRARAARTRRRVHHVHGLRRHATGARVAALQRLLRRAGIHVAVDGRFGAGTTRAVKRFQRRHGLTADGIVGPETLSALRAAARHRAHTTTRRRATHRTFRLGQRPLKFKRRGPDVAALQRLLLHAGYSVSVDGMFGPGTRSAVKSFQRSHGLVADGIVGPYTLQALRHPGSHPGASTSGGHITVTSDGYAIAPAGAPAVVKRLVAAGNRIAKYPYKWGGGHGTWTDSGYDCSGSVSYVLHAAGLLSSSRDSTGFESYGSSGYGRWITIYGNSGHAYLTVGGARFDTSMEGADGSRWSADRRDPSGYVIRHPTGW